MKNILTKTFSSFLIFLFLIATARANDIFYFNRDLKLNDQNVDVNYLQKYLNRDPQTQLSTSGAGAPGEETSFFGPKTFQSVLKFQNKYADEILAPIGLSSATGYVGPKTREKLNSFNSEMTFNNVDDSRTISNNRYNDDDDDDQNNNYNTNQSSFSSTNSVNTSSTNQIGRNLQYGFSEDAPYISNMSISGYLVTIEGENFEDSNVLETYFGNKQSIAPNSNGDIVVDIRDFGDPFRIIPYEQSAQFPFYAIVSNSNGKSNKYYLIISLNNPNPRAQPLTNQDYLQMHRDFEAQLAERIEAGESFMPEGLELPDEAKAINDKINEDVEASEFLDLSSDEKDNAYERGEDKDYMEDVLDQEQRDMIAEHTGSEDDRSDEEISTDGISGEALAIVGAAIAIAIAINASTQASRVGWNVPFGGYVLFSLTCTCTANMVIFMIDFTLLFPKLYTILYQPGVSWLHSYYNIVTPLTPIKGTFFIGPQCYFFAVLACIPIPTVGTIMPYPWGVGTALEPGGIVF